MNKKYDTWVKFTRSYSVWDDNNIKGFFGFKDGEYAWLSNFYKTEVFFDGILYPSAENAYQAQKVISEFRYNFININPKESKNIWKTFPLEDKGKEDWDKRKYDIMLGCVFNKFYKNKELRKKLLNTENKYLEERNHWGDLYWGTDFKTGEGLNNLGGILMKVRRIFKD